MRRVILLILLASLLLVIGATVWLALALRPARIREHLITAVSDRFAARIEVDSAEVADPARDRPSAALGSGFTSATPATRRPSSP